MRLSGAWKRSALGVGVIAALLLAACAPGPASGGTPSPPAQTQTASAATATAKPAVPVKLAVNAGVNFSNLAAHYAVKEGLLAKRGYTAELVLVPNDTTGIQGLLAGSYQVLTQGISSALTAASQGANIVLVDSICPLVDYQFVARASITSLKQLEGKTVGVSAPGAISEQVPKLVLLRQGVNVSKVQFVAIGGDADRAKAMTAGKIDAAVVNTVNTLAAIQADPTLHILVDAGHELSSQFLNTGVVTTKSVAKDQKQMVQDVTAALLEATRALQSDRAKAVDFAMKQGMPATSGQAYDLLNKAGPYFPVSGGLSRTVFEFTVQSLVANGQLRPASLRWEDAVDLTFAEAALKELGPYK